MTHKGSGVRNNVGSPGNPGTDDGSTGNSGTSGGQGNAPVTQADLTALRQELLDLIENLPDPLLHRLIQNIDIVNATIESAKIKSLEADKITTGNLLATISITSGLIQTGTSPNARIELTADHLNAYDSSNRATLMLVTTGGNSQLRVIRSDGMDNYVAESYSNASADGARFVGRRAEGTIGSFSAVTLGDDLTELIGAGAYNTSSFYAGASIVMRAIENWSSSNRGAEIRFNTTKTGTSTGKVRWVISDDGQLVSQVDTADDDSASINFRDKAAGNRPGAATSGFNLYCRNNNLIAQYDDGGTVRYKYLDLSGTGVTWQHTTTAGGP